MRRKRQPNAKSKECQASYIRTNSGVVRKQHTSAQKYTRFLLQHHIKQRRASLAEVKLTDKPPRQGTDHRHPHARQPQVMLHFFPGKRDGLLKIEFFGKKYNKKQPKNGSSNGQNMLLLRKAFLYPRKKPIETPAYAKAAGAGRTTTTHMHTYICTRNTPREIADTTPISFWNI